MGIRRRRRQLTTLMNRMDQRVRSVELRPISLLTQAQISSLVATGATATDTSPTVVSADAPSQWTRVTSAWLYPKKATGLKADYVEVMFEADLGLSTGDSIEVSGIHYTSAGDIEVSGSFKVTGTDTSPWTSRPTYSHDPDAGITNTYTYSPGTATPTTWSSMRQLRGKQAMYSYSATGSTVTITFATAHKFKVDDVISVDLNVEKPVLFGLDGIYKVASVTSTTLTYTLSTALDIPINTTVVTGTLYVFPMAHKYVREGATWADSTNNKTWYWDGLRWIDYSSVADPVRDGDPPAAPTGFSATSEGTVVGTNSALPLSKITLNWTAPTLTKAGKALDDLVGYTVKWRKNANESWKSKVIKEQVTSYTFDSDALFEQNQKYYFQLTAFDSGLQDSDLVATDLTTSVKATTLTSVAPSAPIVTSKLGVFTVRWDGNLATTPATTPPSDTAFLQIHYSTTSNFTPSDSTLKGTVQAIANNIINFAGLTYGVTYYFKFLLKDSSGAVSLASLQASSQVTPLVDTDIIGKVISGAKIVDGSITASDAIIGNTITGGLIQGRTIEAGSIKANAITANEINAGSIAAVVVTAETVTSQVMSGSKYVEFNAGSGTDVVRLGYGTGDYANNPGIAITSGGTYTGWAGSWGSGDMEVATSFLNCYLDFFRSDNSIVMRGQTITITANPLGSGTSTGYMNLESLRLTQFGAMTVTSSNASAFRVQSSAGGYHMSLNANVNGTAEYARLFVDPKSTARIALQLEGSLTHYGSTNLSSRRFKEDIKPYGTTSSIENLLDIELVSYKYLNIDGASTPEATDQVGVIAEELDALGVTDLVVYEEDGITPKGVDYSRFGLFLIPIVRDLKNEIKELKDRLGA